MSAPTPSASGALTLGREELRIAAKLIAKPDAQDSHWCNLAAVLGRIQDEAHYQHYTDVAGAVYASARAFAEEELDIGYERYMELMRLWRLMQGTRNAIEMDAWFGIRKSRALLLRKVLSLGADPAIWVVKAKKAQTTDQFRQEVQRQLGQQPWTTITIPAPVEVAELFEQALASKLLEVLGEPAPAERAKDRDVRFQCLEAMSRDTLERGTASALLDQLRRERQRIDQCPE